MGNVIIDESNLTNIANSIRAKNGSQTTYTPGQMSTAISSIPTNRLSPNWVTFNEGGISNSLKRTSLDLNWLDTSNISNMSYMFYENQKLVSLNLSHFDFSNVTSHEKMFYNCGTSTPTRLTIIYVKDIAMQNWILSLSSNDRPSRWSTSNVIIKT